MQVTETLNEGLKRAYKIVLSAAELDEKVDAKLKEAQPSVEMKGFRKGKVPMAMLKRQFGNQVMGEAMQETIDGAMSEHFESSGDKPAAQPDVRMTNEDWKPGDDVEVDMSYERLPDIPETDFSAIALERLVVKAADADVEEALGNLAETAQDFKDRRKGSKAKDGDQVTMNFVGRIDGEAFEGGAGEDYPLVLGSNSFIPGFEDQLVGSKAGDAKDVIVTFPEDYQAEALAGKEAVFECTVSAVKEPVAAEINDDLAGKFGAETLDDLKGQISERLEAEYSQAARMIVKRGLMDALDEAVSFELPPSLVEVEAKQIAQQLAMEAKSDDEATDETAEAGAATEAEPTAEHTQLAERRVRLGLLLAEVGQKQEITVTDAEMSQAVMQQAQQYPGMERQFFEFIQQNEAMQQQIRAPLFEDKVVDYILELAAVSDKQVSKEELQQAVEALEDSE